MDSTSTRRQFVAFLFSRLRKNSGTQEEVAALLVQRRGLKVPVLHIALLAVPVVSSVTRQSICRLWMMQAQFEVGASSVR